MTVFFVSPCTSCQVWKRGELSWVYLTDIKNFKDEKETIALAKTPGHRKKTEGFFPEPEGDEGLKHIIIQLDPWASAGGGKRAFVPPLEIGTKKQKFLNSY